MSTEELKKELEKLKDFKVYVFEGDVYVEAEDYRDKAIENKNLKAKCDMIELRLSQFKRDNKDLEEENKNLKEYLNASFKREESIRLDYESSLLKIKDLEEGNRNINERIRFLEQCLDNKEKVNISLREEIKELNKMMLFETELKK